MSEKTKGKNYKKNIIKKRKKANKTLKKEEQW